MRRIGAIGNYYGEINVKEEAGRYFWAIEDWTDWLWEEIPKSLYDELMKFEDNRIKAKTEVKDEA